MGKKWKTHPETRKACSGYRLPDEIIFGTSMLPFMFQCEYKDSSWGELEMLPYGPIQLAPSAKVLHYSQEIFEGMKAYRVSGNGPRLFRPEKNWQRMNWSATRMAMPEIPKEIFMTAVEAMAGYATEWIPQNSGESLYIRPFMIATEANVGIRPSTEFSFMVIGSPAGNYFKKDSVSVMIEREHARAIQGGTGTAKTGGNYAASLYTEIERAKLGYDQTLWTDAKEHRYCEELSGMNIFAVINNVLCTPELNGTILEGITRDSVITLAREKGYEIKEMPIQVDELIQTIQNKSCTEMFACGTAVIITPISSLGEKDGTRYQLSFPKGNLSRELRQELLDIQEGRKVSSHNWSTRVSPLSLSEL